MPSSQGYVSCRTAIQLGWLIVVLGVADGCGDSRPRLAPVSGSITYKGNAVEAGTVTFYPVSGGRPAIGRIETDGSYRMSSFSPGDGVAPGEYRVSVESRNAARASPSFKTFEEELAHDGVLDSGASVAWRVPEQFARPDTSGLTAVVANASNVIDFELPVPSKQ